MQTVQADLIGPSRLSASAISGQGEPDGERSTLGTPINPDIGQEARNRERRRFRLHRTLVHGLGGVIFGCAVLHPLAMAVFAWFSIHDGADAWRIWEAMLESFSQAMLPMATVFAVFGLILGAMDGYYRSFVQFQRDDLARELQLKKGYRLELERAVDVLQAQNRRLSELELSKRRTTRFLVHDLKNHLGCILGYADLLLKASQRGTERARRDSDALERVRRQASWMAAAVNDLLDLARLDEVPGIERRRVKALTLLEEAVDTVALPPDHGQVHIDRTERRRFTVSCDARLITRVLSNLILNAVKHNHAEVVVTLGAYRKGQATVFECRDTGDSIPDTTARRIFREFSTSRGTEGLTPSHGLGLAFCRAAVAAHGGRVWLDNLHKNVKVFAFTIPDPEATKAHESFEAHLGG